MAQPFHMRSDVIIRREAEYQQTKNAHELATLQERWGREDAAAEAGESRQAREIADMKARLAHLEHMLDPQHGALIGALVAVVDKAARDLRKSLPLTNISFDYDGERAITCRAGETTKDFKIPLPIYRGVFEEGRIYEANDLATFNGSVWIALETTCGGRPGTGPSWRLAVKAGRDARKPAPSKEPPLR